MSNADNIQYLVHKDIDKQKWDDCITRSANGLIYGYSFYLDHMARQVWVDYDKRISARRNVLQLPPYEEMKRTVVDQFLNDQSGLIPELAARLRTKLGLPPAASPPPTGAAKANP